MTYEGCDVTLCTVDGGGHTWPGGLPVPTLGATTTDISATDAMWTFFSAHHL
jgi:polyhydroxybutyrate depolymerase